MLIGNREEHDLVFWTRKEFVVEINKEPLRSRLDLFRCSCGQHNLFVWFFVCLMSDAKNPTGSDRLQGIK